MTSPSKPVEADRRYWGLQWKLTGLLVGVLLLGSLGGLFLGRTGLLPTPRIILTLTGASLAIGGYIGLAVSRPLKRRLRSAEQFAGALARGDFGPRLTIGSYDEIGQLEDRLNYMAGEMAAGVARLQALAEDNRALAEESGRLAALEERTRLARDLHDTVNQRLFSLALLGAGARRRLSAVSAAIPAEVPADLEELERVARETHAEMRQLIMHLRPTTLEQHGLEAALAEYAEQLAEREGLEASVAVIVPRRLDPGVEEHLFRVTQEALNNVVKHAEAGRVAISLFLEAGSLTLRISDDGRGINPGQPLRPTAVGLKGMRERAASLGGQLRVSPGNPGTVVELVIPWEVAPQ